jgi:uncharacterized protein
MKATHYFSALFALTLCGCSINSDTAASKSSAGETAQSTKYRSIRWEELAPASWDPMGPVRDLDLGSLRDADPKAIEALEQLTQMRNHAPVVATMQDQQIRLSGFIVPVTKVKQGITEFLLVPHFGACIHTPPPPSNMVLFIKPDKPLKDAAAMDTVTIAGNLKIDRTESPWGSSGYRIDEALIEAHTAASAVRYPMK